jgi:RNA polymerase sigma factor (sigma-70 family)
VNEDDLHDAVVSILPRIDSIRDIAAYLARATFHRRLRRQYNSEVQAKYQTYRRFRPKITKRSLLDEAERQEAANAIREAVARLPVRERLMAELFLHEELDCASIAKRLEWSLGIVRNLLFRARRRLSRSVETGDH